MAHGLTVRELASLYLLRCRVEGKSLQTMTAYTYTLGRFTTALLEDHAPLTAAAVRAEDIYQYLGRFTHLTLDTRHRYFREVRCFFNWAHAAGHIPTNPCLGIRAVRLPQKIIQPFTAADITVLLDCCDRRTVAGARDYAIILTLLDCGLRCSELVQLDLTDLSLTTRRVRVLHAKGNKQRVVSFAERCAEALEHYLDFRGPSEGRLFPALGRHRELDLKTSLGANGLKQMLRRLGKQTGLAKVHAHRFRHTFATWAIQNDARELDVQYLLGHSSADMVRRYSSSYRSEQAAMRHAAFSPADRMLRSI